MTHATSEIPEKRSITLSVLFWLAFSIIAVALRGVRWEETYEHALVITRTVPYPEGHPFFIYCRNVFSGQSYLSALIMTIVDCPLLINGFRNVLQLSFCTVPVFLLGARISGSVRGGHLGVVLVLAGIQQGFQSYYPIESWPHFFATGQIGAGYALLIFALLLSGGWRSAWFLLGLMPIVHVGQWPVIGLFAGLQWLWLLRRGDYPPVRQAMRYFSAGLVPCVLFFFVQRHFHVPMPTGGAWFAEGDVRAIWAAYTERHDLHRAVPRAPFSRSVLAVVLVICVSGTLALRNDGMQRVAFQVLGFALLLGGVVCGIWLVQQVLGSHTPFLLIGWMPYRLMNHLAILLVPLAVGVLWRGGHGGRGLLALLLLYILLMPLWKMLLPVSLFSRYAGNLDGVMYALCGGAIASAWAASIGKAAVATRRSLLAAMPLILLVVWLAFNYPFALAAFLAGFLALVTCGLGLRRWVTSAEKSFSCLVVALGCMVLVCLVVRETRHREHLVKQPVHTEVADWLDAHGEKDAMLVTPYWDVNWLAKIHRPIFADYQTAHLMSYVPALAPSLKKMHQEVFGFVVDGESGEPLATWPDRSAAEWRRLGEAYGFRYVLAPTEMDLKLDCVFEGQPYDLYRVSP